METCGYEKFGFIGKPVAVRTVTMIYVGVLIGVHKRELVLEDASWIPETGRWQQFVADGTVEECEPYPDGAPVIIGRGSVLDVTHWLVDLPRSQK